jgi:hypothetical protein
MRNQSISNSQMVLWVIGFFAQLLSYQSYSQLYAHCHNKLCPVAFKLHHDPPMTLNNLRYLGCALAMHHVTIFGWTLETENYWSSAHERLSAYA